jgi:hypothetical protein
MAWPRNHICRKIARGVSPAAAACAEVRSSSNGPPGRSDGPIATHPACERANSTLAAFPPRKISAEKSPLRLAGNAMTFAGNVTTAAVLAVGHDLVRKQSQKNLHLDWI